MIFIEIVLLLLSAGLGVAGALRTVEIALDVASLRGQSGDPGLVEAAAHTGLGWYVAGVVLVALARGITALRRGDHIGTPLLLPAVYGATALGLCIQYGYGNPFSSDWPGPEFAKGVFYGSALAAALLVVPIDIPGLVHRFRPIVGGFVVLLFGALALFGQEPGGSGAKINLFGVQPIEAVKIAAVLFLGSYLGQRASKLRYQRTQASFLRFPRPRLLLPALAALVGTIAGLFLVHDLGPTLILGGVFLGLFYVVTRSSGWVLLALGLLFVLLTLLGLAPDLAPSASVALRLRMWTDPWYNGLQNGDQLVLAFWTLAAGGVQGTGIGSGWPGALPAGHTDLAFAHVVEELGWMGGSGYLLLLGTAIADGLRVAARNRTPERVLMAAGLALLMGAQASVILGGTLGLIPLTGVVVPYLSYGKSGMAGFLAVAALIARLGENGEVKTDTDELKELRGGVVILQLATAVMVLLFIGATGFRAVWNRDELTLRPSITTLKDGTARLLSDPRISAIAQAIRRGSIMDRKGDMLAESDADGKRTYPLGSALGTLLGPPTGGLMRAAWSVERQQDTTLRGWPDRADGPAVWLAHFKVGEEDSERVVLAVASAAVEAPSEHNTAQSRSLARGGSETVRRIKLASPDYSQLLPIVRMPLHERKAEVERLSYDLPPRSIHLTLDAKLQQALAAQVKQAAVKSKVGAAAAVILDPATGEILARAQWPDYDPSAEDWKVKRLKADPKFMGVYGAWSDKTGINGVFQAGSVFKILTSVLAVREGLVVAEASACPTSSAPKFPCNQVSDGRTSFTLPSWSQPIHDHGDGGGKGTLDLISGIIHSSNVYFAQLGLQLGSPAFRKLREEGVEFGNPGLLNETEGPWTGLGSAGSRRLAQTAFGQGAGAWSVVQAARLIAAVANGGDYIRCPASMLLAQPCEKKHIIPTESSMAPILSGMQGVMQSGTGAKLSKVPGVRIYGKTGTADAPGTLPEKPWGLRPGQLSTPHSWFVAIAEPSTAPACADATAGRYVIATVVPHGGFGASAAGPLAISAIKALQTQGYLPAAPPAQ